MSDSDRAAWKRSVVRIWAPIATVVSALKVLLFDLPEIYHKVTGNVSLAVIGQILKYSGLGMFLLICASYPFEKHRFAQRVIFVVVIVGYLWFTRNQPNGLEGAALVGWVFAIVVGISFLASKQQN